MKKLVSKLLKRREFYVINSFLVFVFLPFFLYFTNIYTDITNIWFTMIVYPLFFFLFTFSFCCFKYQKWDIPIQLLVLLMFSLVFTSNSYNGIHLFICILFGYIGCFLAKILRYNKILNKEDKHSKSIFLSYLLPSLYPAILVFVLELYYRSCTFSNIFNNISLIGFIFMIFLTYLIYLIFIGMFRNTFSSSVALSIVYFLIFFVNQMRIFYTGDIFMFHDLLFLETAGEMVNFADVTLVNAIKFLFTPTMIVLLILIWQLSIMYKFSRSFSLKFSRIIGSISFVLFFLLVIPIERFDKFILNTIYDVSSSKDYDIASSNTRYYYKFGVIGGFYGKYLESRRYEPDNYDEERLVQVLNDSERFELSSWDSPNVIVVFSESFWDINLISDRIKFKENVVSNFTKLSNEGKLFNMISPSYGGLSANVEFEILTGGSLNYFSKGYVPYMRLYDKKESFNNPSVINEFKNNGYTTKMLNSSSSTLFECGNVYDKMKLDYERHLFDEDNTHYKSDEEITSILISDFNNKKKDEKLFYFMITMGGHMPYYKDKYDTYHVSIEETKEDDDINDTVLSYAEGIYLADQQLGRLYDYIQSLDEETILIFFGDHLPLLQTAKGRDALDEIYFNATDDNLESIYRKYNTQALILSNYEIEHENYSLLSPDLLLTYVMNHIDMDLSSYYEFLYSTIDILPSSNYVVSMDKNGFIYPTKGLTGSMKDVYSLREQMQYKLFK